MNVKFWQFFITRKIRVVWINFIIIIIFSCCRCIYLNQNVLLGRPNSLHEIVQTFWSYNWVWNQIQIQKRMSRKPILKQTQKKDMFFFYTESLFLFFSFRRKRIWWVKHDDFLWIVSWDDMRDDNNEKELDNRIWRIH